MHLQGSSSCDLFTLKAGMAGSLKFLENVGESPYLAKESAHGGLNNYWNRTDMGLFFS